MSLASGTRLGAYEITGQIGAGGMGEVYRATDTKLGREVAIKTLPAALASDKDRLARFEREAKLLGALSHPHIASVYSLDEHDGTRYLAMELVEGETLEEKLKAGALPVEDALRLALQVAEALEAAHQKGVIHRDLKPANVMVTTDGVVKVLDFGLAKAFSTNAAEASPGQSPALSVAMTQQGLVLGTAGYMSPEQASGQATDQRADVWAFGVLLYEMLTGLPLFSGESVPHILADVLKTEPDWGRLPDHLHLRLKLLLDRCLTKKPRSRLHSIADARIEIEAVLKDPAGVTPPATMASDARSRPGWQWLAGTVAIAIVAAGIGWLLRASPPEPRPAWRFSIPLAFEDGFQMSQFDQQHPSLALTNDGRGIVYWAFDHLMQRDFVGDEIAPRPVPDSSGGEMPFFSADGQWLGFLSNGLRRISLTGGRSEQIVERNDVMGVAWSADGRTLLFGSSASGLFRVSSDGGDPEAVTETTDAMESHRWPEFLPDGRTALFTLVHGAIQTGAAGTQELAVVDLDTGTIRVLMDGAQPRWLPTGHVVFARDSTLWAVRFDLDRAEPIGDPVPVQEGIGVSNAVSHFSINGGTLAYLSGISTDESRLVWVDREGNEEFLPFSSAGFWTPRVSPDGARALVHRSDPSESVWVADFARLGMNQITPDDADSELPLWLDHDTAIYVGAREGQWVTLERRADGGGSESLVALGEYEHHHIEDLSRDGRFLIWTDVGGSNPADYVSYVAELNDTVSVVPFPPDTPGVSMGTFSPDGQWVVYTAYDADERHVYVTPFPEGDRKVLVSVGGGAEPMWSRDGSEIFYRSDRTMMAVSVENPNTMELGLPVALFEGDYVPIPAPAGGRNYDLGADGRFLMVKPTEESREASLALNIALNWFDELDRLVPID